MLVYLPFLENSFAHKEGPVLQNIPPTLSKILPNIRLLEPKPLPGVYGIFFPKENKIYIGESRKVRNELLSYTSGSRTNQKLNSLLQTNKGVIFSFAVFQGSGLQSKQDRLALENYLIDLTKGWNINVLGTPQHGILSQNRIPEDFLKIEFIKGPLGKYGLNFEGCEMPVNKACIYLFINPKSKKFYVGETSDFFNSKVAKRHKGNCAKYYKDIGVKALDQKSVYVRVVQDFVPTNNCLLFTCFKVLEGNSKSERIYEETAVKNLLNQEYPTRMYNSLNSPRKAGEFKHSPETRQRIREATIANQKRGPLVTKIYPCICEGVWYDSVAAASRAYGYKTRDGLSRKFKNPLEVNFIWLKPPVTKPFPTDPILQKKIENFYKNLQRFP